jgi:phospholipid/cholesterol/gamma-HCH transport system permease protein
MATAAGWYETAREGDRVVIRVGGKWTIEEAAELDRRVRRIPTGEARRVRVDLAGIEALDTAGAWLIERTRQELGRRGVEVTLSGLDPAHAALLERVTALGPRPPAGLRPRATPVDALASLGEGIFALFRQSRDLLGFFGAVVLACLRLAAHPGRLRLVSVASHLEQTGFKALPIIGLLSFLIGVVLVYQGVDQLRRFGAEVFTVNLVGITVLREMGVLLTCILVAGRSGSAFTAQIGTMQVNEEVDALRTIGLDPLEVLVVPRLLALIIAVPLLTFFADVMAILGGAIMATVLIDVTIPQFLDQLNQAVTLTVFWVGLVKAPVFAFVIAMVGCFEGLRVQGSAESVGRLTTQSVVESIFLVIVLDAFFSVLFSYLQI